MKQKPAFLRKIEDIPGKHHLIIAILSFLWLLYRTGTKPSRIKYPCQQTALANAGLLVYLLPAFYITGIGKFINRIRKDTQLKKAVLLCICLLAVLFSTQMIIRKISVAGYWRNFPGNSGGVYGIADTDGFKTNASAKALPSPHRVVSVHNSDASTWTGTGNPHTTLDQDAIDQMVMRGVMSLTGETTSVEAWQALIPYNPGEIVEFKLNFNNCDGFASDPYMNPYAEVVKSIIKGLNSIGVPSANIWLADPSRVINDIFRERIGDPDVKYYIRPDRYIGDGRPNVFNTDFVDGSSAYATVSQVTEDTEISIRPAQVFIDADHIINVPQLKAHGGASITLGLKNHFGSIFIDGASGSSPLHTYFYISGNENYGGTEHSYLADINDNPVFRDKTRLVVGDGIMGHPTINFQGPVVWASFGGNPPELLFFGVDPVAVDSVMTDYLNRENLASGQTGRNDDILVYAASIGLGVFEHWDGPDTRNYSSIDYDELEITGDPPVQDEDLYDQEITEGDVVNIVVEAENAEGLAVNLEFYEQDNFDRTMLDSGQYGLPASGIITGGVVRIPWASVWFEDTGGIDTDPELIFIARNGDHSIVSQIIKIIRAQ
ncbi:MAG: DUF362 domain-containing protein [Spirochaetales bacterium]|nr:DUF362 domain-containing protein [Spirochaetales bacterium]